jgi:hypothetical protein
VKSIDVLLSNDPVHVALPLTVYTPTGSIDCRTGGHEHLDDDLVAENDRRPEAAAMAAIARGVRPVDALAPGIVDPELRPLGHLELRDAEAVTGGAGGVDPQAPQTAVGHGLPRARIREREVDVHGNGEAERPRTLAILVLLRRLGAQALEVHLLQNLPFDLRQRLVGEPEAARLLEHFREARDCDEQPGNHQEPSTMFHDAPPYLGSA